MCGLDSEAASFSLHQVRCLCSPTRAQQWDPDRANVARETWLQQYCTGLPSAVRAELDALGISPGGLMRTPEGDEATQTEVSITQPFLPGISVGGVAVCRWVESAADPLGAAPARLDERWM